MLSILALPLFLQAGAGTAPAPAAPSPELRLIFEEWVSDVTLPTFRFQEETVVPTGPIEMGPNGRPRIPIQRAKEILVMDQEPLFATLRQHLRPVGEPRTVRRPEGARLVLAWDPSSTAVEILNSGPWNDAGQDLSRRWRTEVRHPVPAGAVAPPGLLEPIEERHWVARHDPSLPPLGSTQDATPAGPGCLQVRADGSAVFSATGGLEDPQKLAGHMVVAVDTDGVIYLWFMDK